MFLLYLSSVEYNYQRKDEVLKILKSKKINCLFYSINEEYFTYDFGNNLTIFLPTVWKYIQNLIYMLNKYLVKGEEQMNYCCPL